MSCFNGHLLLGEYSWKLHYINFFHLYSKNFIGKKARKKWKIYRHNIYSKYNIFCVTLMILQKTRRNLNNTIQQSFRITWECIWKIWMNNFNSLHNYYHTYLFIISMKRSPSRCYALNCAHSFIQLVSNQFLIKSFLFLDLNKYWSFVYFNLFFFQDCSTQCHILVSYYVTYYKICPFTNCSRWCCYFTIETWILRKLDLNQKILKSFTSN